MLLSADPSPQPKRHLDWFSHFCTAHGRVSSGVARHVLSPKFAPSHRYIGDLDPGLLRGFLSPPKPTTQTRSLKPVLHSSQQSIPILYNGPPFLPSKLPIVTGDVDLVPTLVLNPDGISIGSTVSAGLTSVTDTVTDHATQSVTVGRIYVCSTAMQPKR